MSEVITFGASNPTNQFTRAAFLAVELDSVELEVSAFSASNSDAVTVRLDPKEARALAAELVRLADTIDPPPRSHDQHAPPHAH